MESKRQAIDKVYVERRNGEHKHRIQYYADWVQRMTSDTDRKKRLQSQ